MEAQQLIGAAVGAIAGLLGFIISVGTVRYRRRFTFSYESETGPGHGPSDIQALQQALVGVPDSPDRRTISSAGTEPELEEDEGNAEAELKLCWRECAALNNDLNQTRIDLDTSHREEGRLQYLVDNFNREKIFGVWGRVICLATQHYEITRTVYLSLAIQEVNKVRRHPTAEKAIQYDDDQRILRTSSTNTKIVRQKAKAIQNARATVDPATQATVIVLTHSGSQASVVIGETSEQEEEPSGSRRHFADGETQTATVGAAAGWERLVFRARKISWLRRLKSQLADHLKIYDGLYVRTKQ